MMKKLPIIIFFILLAVLIFVWRQFGSPFGGKLLESKPPVSFESKVVSAVFVTYRFTSAIKEINTDGGDTEIALSSPDAELPAFSLKGAKISTVENGKLIPASISNLSKATRVTVEAFYDVKNGTWTTVSVFIAPQQPPAVR